MTVFHLFAFVAEILVAMFIIWGFLHEDRFISFERRLWAQLRKAVRK